MFPPSSDSGASHSSNWRALAPPINGASAFLASPSSDSLAPSAYSSLVTAPHQHCLGPTATPLVSLPHPPPCTQHTPSPDESLFFSPSFDEQGRPLRYRCQSDTAVGQQYNPVCGHRGTLHYSLPTSYRGIEAAFGSLPRRLHCPSLASLPQDVTCTPASVDSSVSDLRLTAEIPTAPSPVPDCSASRSRGPPLSSTGHSLHHQLPGAVTPVLSASSIARILDASVAKSRPEVAAAGAVSPDQVLPLPFHQPSRSQPAPGPSMASPPPATGAPPRYPMGPLPPAPIANGAGQPSSSYYGQLPRHAAHPPSASRINSGITGSGIVAAPPTPRKEDAHLKAPRANLLAPPAVTTGAPYATSSTHDRQWVRASPRSLCIEPFVLQGLSMLYSLDFSLFPSGCSNSLPTG